MKIFWAWQSDTPGKTGRFFVRDVLRAAIEQLKSEAEIVEPTERETRDAMELDHDRKNVPGSPDLANTILEKIEAAVVFVADVTPVGEVTTNNQQPPKKLINSNVAIELGYSLRTRTDRSLLMVMNTHYGSRTDLPFDVVHKAGPLTFDLAPDADQKAITAESVRLKAELVEALRLCIADAVEERKREERDERTTDFVGPATFFRPDEVLASAGEPGQPEYLFPHRRMAYMHIAPTSGNVRPGRAQLAKIFREKKPRVMTEQVGGVAMRNSEGWIIFEHEGSTITALTQGFETGGLWGVTAQLFKTHPINAPITGKPSPQPCLPMVTFEKVYTRVLRNYVQVERAFGLSPPYRVVVGVVGLKGVYLTVPAGGEFGNGDILDPIQKDCLQREHRLVETNDHSIAMFLREYFCALYDLADSVRADVWTDAQIAAYDVPPR